MTMTVELGALEKVVEGLVAHGRFGSKSEVLREGVRLVEEREARLAKLYADLDVGIAEADAGLMIPMEDARDEILAELRAMRDA